MSQTDDELLESVPTASYLKVQPETLRVWAWKGHGPAYIKVGRQRLYRRSDLDKWLNEQRVDPSTRTA
jgi:excisionase family DNA binding protein